ncbi:hypothetical protein GC167_10280 [bacterium]|nr:hypothetical protein [bacterium]
MEKRRVIVDYRNITQELLELLTTTYPYGYDDAVVRFKNAKGELVSSVPLETDDTRYLVKVSMELDRKVEAYLDDFEEDSNQEEAEDKMDEGADVEEASEEDTYDLD